MNISNVQARQVLGAYLNKVERNQSAEAASASSETPPDAVDISPEARALAVAHQIVKSQPPVRTERVTALRQQIEEGQYGVDSERVADKIIEAMRAARGK